MYYTNDVGQSHSDGGISNLNFDVAFLQNKNFEVANFFFVLNSNNAYEALRKSFRQDRPTSRSGTNVSQLHTPRLSSPSPSLISLAMIRISPRTPCFDPPPACACVTSRPFHRPAPVGAAPNRSDCCWFISTYLLLYNTIHSTRVVIGSAEPHPDLSRLH